MTFAGAALVGIQTNSEDFTGQTKDFFQFLFTHFVIEIGNEYSVVQWSCGGKMNLVRTS